MLPNTKHALYTIQWVEMSILLIINNFFNTGVGYLQYGHISETTEGIITYKRTYKEVSDANPIMDIYFNATFITLKLNDIDIITINLKELIDKEHNLCVLMPDIMILLTEALHDKLDILQKIKDTSIKEELPVVTKPLVEIIDTSKNLMYVVDELIVEARAPEDDGESAVCIYCTVINHVQKTTELKIMLDNKTIAKIKQGTKIYYINNQLDIVVDGLIN